jgi:MSHA biogenesis protein MshP
MSPNNIKNQHGFLMPLAIFIVVVMGVFALAISRTTIQASTSGTLEFVSTQAFYAAESGTQRAMQTLFFPDASSRQQVDNRCENLNVTHNFTVPGLNGCSAVVTCTCRYADNSGSNCAPGTPANYTSSAPQNITTSFYTITSTATCGSGTLRAVRTIQAGSFLKQE